MNVYALNLKIKEIKSDVHDLIEYSEKVSNLVDLTTDFNNKKKNTHDKEFLVELGSSYPYVFFTEREAHCSLLLILGLTSKEMSKRLSLSSRTVEHYLKKAKEKLSIQSRSSFIASLIKSDFIKNISILIDI